MRDQSDSQSTSRLDIPPTLFQQLRQLPPELARTEGVPAGFDCPACGSEHMRWCLAAETASDTPVPGGRKSVYACRCHSCGIEEHLTLEGNLH